MSQRDLDPNRTLILRAFQTGGSPKLRERTGKPQYGPALQWTGMPTTVRSHAKINLGLYIGAPRRDGFHALGHRLPDTRTARPRHVIEPAPGNDHVNHSDRRTTTAFPPITAILRGRWSPSRWKILEPRPQVAIHIEKRLPIQGGLGAGSANAVAALVGLEAELGTEPSALSHFRASESSRVAPPRTGTPARRGG